MGMDLDELLPFDFPDESRWHMNTVRYKFGNCEKVTDSGVSVSDAKAAVRSAANTWNRIGLPLRLEELDGDVEIEVAWFARADDPDDGFFSLFDPEQAHADFPPPNNRFGNPPTKPLPLHFNGSEKWSVDINDQSSFDIETIALHEFGHCLGLFSRWLRHRHV